MNDYESAFQVVETASSEPQYLEVFEHGPLLAIRLQGARTLVSSVPPLELVKWARQVEPVLASTALELDLFKLPCREMGTQHLWVAAIWGALQSRLC